MLNVSKLTFELRQLIGDVELILLSSRPTFEYKNGVKTDNVVGTTYTVVENGGDFEKFNVKVLGVDNAIDPEFIKNSKSHIKVDFENTVCKLYSDSNHRLQVSVSADNITIL